MEREGGEWKHPGDLIHLSPCEGTWRGDVHWTTQLEWQSRAEPVCYNLEFESHVRSIGTSTFLHEQTRETWRRGDHLDVEQSRGEDLSDDQTAVSSVDRPVGRSVRPFCRLVFTF